MKNQKSNQPELKSFSEVDAVLLNIAKLKLKAEKEQNEMNQKILGIKNQYEPGINEKLSKQSEYEEQLEAFCRANKKEFLTIRSKELTYGRIGFRTGKNALKLLSKQFTWKFVEEKFSSLFSNKYVTIKTKLNKTKILADAEKGIITAEQLAVAGCKTARGETAFYEINYDEIKLVDE